MINAQLLQDITVLAQAAGAAIMRVYASDFAVTHKDDDSPITEADLAAHHCIVAGLARLTPGVPVISEESPVPPLAERANWPWHWLVDPLDGTREFVKRNGEFTVNIALIHHGQPVLGVVDAPALGLSYAAARGLGSVQIEGGQGGQVQPLRARPLPLRPTFMVSRSHKEPALQAFLDRAPAHEAHSIGSSLKFCRIAAGLADLYPKFGAICEWDTAAGQCVLEQAGGAVLQLPTLQPLRYNQIEGVRIPPFFAVGDPSVDWADWQALQ